MGGSSLGGGCKAFSPGMVELIGGDDVAETVFGDLAMSPLCDELAHLVTCDALPLGRLNSKCLTVKIEIESARRPVSTAHIVEGELICKIAMRLGLESIPQPVFS